MMSPKWSGSPVETVSILRRRLINFIFLEISGRAFVKKSLSATSGYCFKVSASFSLQLPMFGIENVEFFAFS